MKNTVLALCALSLLGGCGGQGSAAGPTYDSSEPAPTMFKRTGGPMQVYPTENCSKIDKKANSPSIADFPKFTSRLDSGGKYIELALNMSCIRKFYSVHEIEKWKNRGDPVAILAYLDQNYRNYRKVCRDYDYVKSLLILAQKVMVKSALSKYSISRTPEAYIIEVTIDYECRGIEMDGFFYKDLERHNVSPDFFNRVGY